MNQLVRNVLDAEADIVSVSALAPRSEPICFVVDPKPGISSSSPMCAATSTKPHRFEKFSEMVAAGRRDTPDVIFLEPGIDGRDATMQFRHSRPPDFVARSSS